MSGVALSYGCGCVQRRGMLTFLGVRLWDPCEERMEGASSVMVRLITGLTGCNKKDWLR